MRLATRGSALALAQARLVASMLGGDVELVEITTSGDRRRAVDDKREWVAELEDALLRGEADLAVHSAKDVPVRLADGCALVGAPARADPRDALCGAAGLGALPEGARVGTSSLRRAAGLRAVRPDLEVVELRGNVDTRLRRRGEYDAVVLALAGLQRLGRAGEADAVLDELVPAAGQGALALEARADDQAAREAAERITDPDTLACLRCERACVRELGADCRSAVGVYAVVRGRVFTVRAFAGLTDGSLWVRDELTGSEPEALGAEVGRRLLAAGAGPVLSATTR